MQRRTVVVVGVPPADVTVPLPLIQDAQLRIQGSATYLPADFASAIELLASGAVDVSGMIGATMAPSTPRSPLVPTTAWPTSTSTPLARSASALVRHVAEASHSAAERQSSNAGTSMPAAATSAAMG